MHTTKHIHNMHMKVHRWRRRRRLWLRRQSAARQSTLFITYVCMLSLLLGVTVAWLHATLLHVPHSSQIFLDALFAPTMIVSGIGFYLLLNVARLVTPPRVRRSVWVSMRLLDRKINKNGITQQTFPFLMIACIDAHITYRTRRYSDRTRRYLRKVADAFTWAWVFGVLVQLLYSVIIGFATHGQVLSPWMLVTRTSAWTIFILSVFLSYPVARWLAISGAPVIKSPSSSHV